MGVGCARATLEDAGLPLKSYFIVTDLGIDKNKNFDLKREEIDRVKDTAKEMGRRSRPNQTASESNLRFCCD